MANLASSAAAVLGTQSNNSSASANPEGSNQSQLAMTWHDSNGNIVLLRFDVVTAETHETLMAITDHPVEVGANVADNARELPTTLSIEGYITNVPMASNPTLGSPMKLQSRPIQVGSVPLKPSLASVVNAVTNGIANAVTGGGDSKSAYVEAATGNFPKFRAKLVYEMLDQVRAQRSLVRVTTALRSLASMLTTRVAVPRTVADGTGATFNVELRQLRLVSSQTVNAPQPTEARGLIAAATGSKATQPTDADTDQQVQSLMLQQGIAAGLFSEEE